MAEVVCVDGSRLAVLPVPKRDRAGVAYETTLRLELDGAPFGVVGECSGWLLERTADRLRRAQAQHGTDAFPATGVEALVDAGLDLDLDGRGPGRSAAELRRVLPRDRELLCLRARDPDDGDPSGELRLQVREDRTWLPPADGQHGRWSTRSIAVLEAWGASGRGVRCLLDGASLMALLDALVLESTGAVESAGTDRSRSLARERARTPPAPADRGH